MGKDSKKDLQKALGATCLAMDSAGGSQRLTAWAENLGHNISFVSSPLSMLARLGVVKKCKSSGRQGVLRLGDANAKFARRSCTRGERARVHKSLVRWVRFADASSKLIVAPRTYKEWVDQFHALVKSMSELKPPLLVPVRYSFFFLSYYFRTSST